MTHTETTNSTSPTHIEANSTSRSIESPPPDVKEGPPEATPDVKEGPPDGVAWHTLTPHDTLTCLAIRYGSTPARIAAANGILTGCGDDDGALDVLEPGTKLVVPLTADPAAARNAAEEARRAREFDREVLAVKVVMLAVPNLTMAEARYYLGESKWAVDHAVREARADANWAAKNPQPAAKKLHPLYETTATASEQTKGCMYIFERFFNRVGGCGRQDASRTVSVAGPPEEKTLATPLLR